jgi:hypothetical protein
LPEVLRGGLTEVIGVARVKALWRVRKMDFGIGWEQPALTKPRVGHLKYVCLVELEGDYALDKPVSSA